MEDETQQKPLYQYNVLPNIESIRVLVLYPADEKASGLEFDFHVGDRAHFLQSASDSWEAVSYCWGQNPVFSRFILCRKSDTALKITPNVDSLLRHLRKSHKSRRLWIDALCINQTDEMEKAEQVRRMRDTYSEARKVQVWLGDPDRDLPVFSVLRNIAAKRSAPETLDKALLYQCVVDLIQNPWFTRRWILQESAASLDTVFRLGRDKLNRNLLVVALDAVFSPEDTKSELGDAAANALTILKLDRQEPQPILNLLEKFRTSGCSDERDRLFALFPLAKEKHLGASVDYSLPWWQVYTHFARFQVEASVERRTTQLLNQTLIWGSLANLNATWPSWVPNWRNQPREENIYHDVAYICPGQTKVYDTALAISGTIVHMVTFVFARCPNDLSTPHQIREYVINQLDIYMASILRGAPWQGPILSSTELRNIRRFFIETLLCIIKALNPAFVLRHCMPKYNNHTSFHPDERDHIGNLLYPLCPDPNAKFTLTCIENKLHHDKQKIPKMSLCQVCQDMVSAGLFVSVGNVMRDRTIFVSTNYSAKEEKGFCPYVTRFWTSPAKVSIEDGVLTTIFVPTVTTFSGGIELDLYLTAGFLLKTIGSGFHGDNSTETSLDEPKNNSSQISSDSLRNLSSDVGQKDRVFRISEPCHCRYGSSEGPVGYPDRLDIVVI
ncbi:Heterokaryon incompatibility protein (HET) domain containing protein [Hyaloscypha variabilis]